MACGCGSRQNDRRASSGAELAVRSGPGWRGNRISMDDHWTQRPEIILVRRIDIIERVATALIAIGIVVIVLSHAGWRIWPFAPFSLHTAVFVRACALAGVLFRKVFCDDVRWTIRYGEIRIERDSVLGRKRFDTILNGDIARTGIHIHDNDSVKSFFVDIWLQSGRRFRTPEIPTEDVAK